MKEFFLVLLVILVISAVGLGIRILFYPFNTAERMINLANKSQEKTLSADNAIYNYEWFKQQKEDIEALGQKIQTAQLQADQFRVSSGDRKNWTFEDKTEDARLQSVVTGITNQLTQAVADYNARAKMANRNIFQDNILPNYLEVLTFIKK